MIALPSVIASRQDVIRLRIEVERYQAWSRQYQNATRRDIEYQNEQPALSDAASMIIRSWLESKHSSSELIDELNSLVNSSPSMTLTFVAPAPASVQKQLVSWVREKLDPNMLVEFRWNAHIVGGVIAQTNAGVYDWSYRKQLLDSRSKLVERFARV